ncbi:SDR family NAD(P)-dependent oxidoreductase [Agrobacterium cavarae]|uniref:SDR family NAD(P)-dependent oxidoreductase n=2 Tax=Agrobacterium cavarae TaxID=2528239 RepID=A0ABY1YC01_9HYPH|nr:SDR family NAD(P)-dependent oxidoreductase [Agrobacterium cavarae]
MRKRNKMTKSILIVAAERGLGLGLAHQFFRRGWNVMGTSQPDANVDELNSVGTTNPDRLAVAPIDVTDPAQIKPFLNSLGDSRFDVVFMNAGIWGAEHQSVLEATDQEFAEIMLTNTFGPVRLARHLLNYLVMPGGTLAFMSSHRGSIAINLEGGLELYRASKVASNMLARGIYAEHKERGLTVLSIHPGWVSTAMGTLGGSVKADIGIEPSVRGVADVVEKHMATGENLYLDYQDKRLDW